MGSRQIARLADNLGDVLRLTLNGATATTTSALRSFSTSHDESNEEKSTDWRDAMDAGDWDSAWDIFEQTTRDRFEELNVPALEDVLGWDPEGAEKAIRRKKELENQNQQANSRVRAVSDHGVAHGVGKRKTSVARVWMREGQGHVMVNKKPFDMYFANILRRNDVITPLVVSDSLGKFDVMARVEGGGVMAQAQACRHGIAKALQNWDPELRGVLKESGLLSRDARVVERKKPGRKKARKSFAWVKR
jgi:small subunit ribosomal protein S9